MSIVTTAIIICLLLVCCGLLCALLVSVRRGSSDSSIIVSRIETLEKLLERQERFLRDELARGRDETLSGIRHSREEMSGGITLLGDSLLKRMSDIAGLQKNQLELFAGQLKELTASNESRLDKLRDGVDARLRLIQEDNAGKLEQMRATVDEKLHETLEKRLGESFKLVSERHGPSASGSGLPADGFSGDRALESRADHGSKFDFCHVHHRVLPDSLL